MPKPKSTSSNKHEQVNSRPWRLAWLLALMAPAALAADKDPLEYPLRQYLLLLSVALLGGLVSWYAKVRAGSVQAWNVMHLVGELTTSAFAGLLAFWVCEWANAPQLLTISLVGISGHMGARAIEGFERFAQKRWGHITGDKGPQ